LPTLAIPKSESQWRSIIMGSLRDGGPSYFALDVTDPSSGDFPGYMWDFPCEPDHCGSAVNPDTGPEAAYMGSTWSEPAIIRIR
jgi:Tfp pilus tip-associated adhesin PilY1